MFGPVVWSMRDNGLSGLPWERYLFIGEEAFEKGSRRCKGKSTSGEGGEKVEPCEEGRCEQDAYASVPHTFHSVHQRAGSSAELWFP